MKKFTIGLCVYIAFLCIPIEASGSDTKYRIYMDSNTSDTYETKEKMLAIFSQLCDRVAKESYATLLKENRNLFEKIEGADVKWKNNTLILTIGNGKGSTIKGTFEKENVCFEEVKPKSKIQEWLGME